MAQEYTKLSQEELISLVERKSEEVDVLTEINRRLKGHFEIGSLLKEIMNTTKKILKSEACSLLLVDEETQQLFFYVTDDSGSNLDQFRIEKGQGVVGAVFESGEPLIVNNAQQDPRFFKGVDAETGFVTKSLACVPMTLGRRVIGVVEVLNKLENDYAEDDLQILETLASQSALAIEYVRANEKRSMNERMAVVGNMAAAVIHDLRNSMQVISGFSQLIALQQPDQKENCEIIRSEIDKLVQMSQEILEFSRGSKISISPKNVSLIEFIRNLHALNKTKLSEEKVDFQLELLEDVTISIDVVKMQRVIQNIISNAVDALSDDRVIVITGGLMESKAMIKIKDHGQGMDAETQKNLFKPFFTKGKAGGTGLGMAIVHNIISSHNATIQVDSELGEGTTFILDFPIIK